MSEFNQNSKFEKGENSPFHCQKASQDPDAREGWRRKKKNRKEVSGEERLPLGLGPEGRGESLQKVHPGKPRQFRV
jgi:hypothetical protein